MAQTGRSNVRYVDPQRRYTVVLGPSWNAPFGALPHDDRAGTHDSADGRCGSYASVGRGQAALWTTSRNFCRVNFQEVVHSVPAGNADVARQKRFAEDRMDTHKNARLTSKGREQMVRAV